MKPLVKFELIAGPVASVSFSWPALWDGWPRWPASIPRPRTVGLFLLFQSLGPSLHSKGTLEADIGMTMAAVRQRSTVRWREPAHMGDGSDMLVEDMVFEYRLGTPQVRFPQSRYFWLRTATNGRLADINIGITPRKLPLKQIQAFQLDVQRRLFSAGWMPGHLVADSDETVHMWGGKRTSQRDEPPGSGQFVLYLHLEPKSGARDVVFEPSAWNPAP